MKYTREQDDLVVDALRRMKRAGENLEHAEFEVNMERPAKAADILNETRLEILFAEATLRKINV